MSFFTENKIYLSASTAKLNGFEIKAMSKVEKLQKSIYVWPISKSKKKSAEIRQLQAIFCNENSIKNGSTQQLFFIVTYRQSLVKIL